MIVKIFNDDYLRRLDNIIQWLEKDTLKRESVAGHSFKVSVFCRVLLEDIFGNTDDTNILKFKLDCVTFALLHDWDEALIRRDISHEIKYNKWNGDEFRALLDKLSSHYAIQEFGPLNDSDSADMIIRNIINPGDLIHSFVKICDWLAMEYFLIREMRMGNKQFIETSDYCIDNACKQIYFVKSLLKENFKNDAKINELDKLSMKLKTIQF
jgi:5'-deoxynucleotidase YfbR-like HD superfamily hydrolase